MSQPARPPRILVIDDLSGRVLADRRNEERASLCGQYLLEDVTGDERGKGVPLRIKQPVAEAVFHRGQLPNCSTVGDVVENDLAGCLRVIRDGWLDHVPAQRRWVLVLLDLCFHTGRVTRESDRRTCGVPEGRDRDVAPQDYFGLQILRRIQQEFPDLPVVMLSSKPRQEVARDFSERGACGFLARDDPDSPRRLEEFLLRYGLLPDETGEVTGCSKALLFALRRARNVAMDRRHVLIRGDRGTGKELLARYIHRHRIQSDGGPLITVDSGALSPHLYTSELFGHKRGAFTGAAADRCGRIVQADGGDLFLDEIGNMPPEVQVGLLRTLESGEVVPVGATRGERIRVRVLSATNEDIDSKAQIGGFRADLLDRLQSGGKICLPPLRDRRQDIPLLVERFLREAEGQRPAAFRREVSDDATEELLHHHWPGNVRELRSCVFNAVTTYPDIEHLFPAHLGLPGSKKRSEPARLPEPEPQAPSAACSMECESIDSLIEIMTALRLDRLRPVDLAGSLPKLESAYARLLAGCLKAALMANSRTTADQPRVRGLIHPAMKLLTGNQQLSGAKAAGLVKRLLQTAPAIMDVILAEPMLREAYETACRLRPSQPKGSSRGTE